MSRWQPLYRRNKGGFGAKSKEWHIVGLGTGSPKDLAELNKYFETENLTAFVQR
jgi:hypothetical protein